MEKQSDQACCHPDEVTSRRRFADRHRLGDVDVLLELERAVFGVDYGGTGWTDLAEAEGMAGALGLAPGVSLLELGTGAGWPGVFLASVSGCTATLTDLPLAGLRRARARAATEGLDGRCRVVAADARRLPFANQSFDAVVHSDVLCCLPAKAAVLRECRRVVGPSGRMVWSVISVVEGLEAGAHAEAVAAGPTFVETTSSYPELLTDAGWRVEQTEDVTAMWQSRMRQSLHHVDVLAERLEAVLGSDGLEELRRTRRARLAATEDGLLQRWIHTSVAA